ncbi:Colicin I receptor precursor [Sphingobacterium spiritivorum]|uniref:TonB-dependent receptor plug domain protein n=2 Tax=Sphingobacterium spiritivorum TaxID=258 RepID=D7VR62_SPHSI|nr:TonB-dependent receptor plug domain protein [Sphingobacterium spiritivorum ATCC 33861]SUJ08438.1 Colicin I receptor precursor [Sphingobacterium spiritivorum]
MKVQMKTIKINLMLGLWSVVQLSFGQSGTVRGTVRDQQGNPMDAASVRILKQEGGTLTDSSGNFHLKNIPFGNWQLQVTSTGFKPQLEKLTLNKDHPDADIQFVLGQTDATLEEVVVTGTMRTVRRLDSPVPVEVFTPAYFKKNPTPSLFDAVGMINGVKPQLNCNVCNTGDIHINGMEGPYTMILIDGMPIVSALSTVYGLSGIPNSLVERLEVVKGPASSLYGSEAMGGIINVITKNPSHAPRFTLDLFGTTWGEGSFDGGTSFRAGKATSMLGVNYYNFQQKTDHNKDNFTDMTLQNRVSVFNKWKFDRKDNKLTSIAARYVYEDRWGGEMNWNKSYRGSSEVYGESIYTRRAEVIGVYELPVAEKITTQFSYNWHDQNSWYGDSPYMATQKVGFVQTYWDKEIIPDHNFLLGASYRYTWYDDNTPATASKDGEHNQPATTPLPGLFIQDEWKVNDKHTVLLGYRFDHDQHHGSVHSPRIAYKLSPDSKQTIRASFGTGFRVVNLFTEDHAALTGARDVVIAEQLNPERSYNSNLNYNLRVADENFFMGLDITGFYSYFTNKITGDFDTDPNKIIYQNLRGHAISNGISVNTDLKFNFPLKIMAGVTLMDVYQQKNEAGQMQRVQQLHAPKWSGNFIGTYSLPKGYVVDLTANWTGPMRLPIQPDDYRPEYSPWFCIANIQATKLLKNGVEIYGGIKNLFNFVPKYPLMRPFDPFDKTVDDPVNNPYGYTFDTEYNYASMQGIRGFLGIRYNIFK